MAGQIRQLRETLNQCIVIVPQTFLLVSASDPYLLIHLPLFWDVMFLQPSTHAIYSHLLSSWSSTPLLRVILENTPA